ncbi:hypothetical protein VCR29J2_30077 [Vibrio coralliirubri]|nr:hypothetical protein VCR29J2_30077 [Vibrio coralliirubri]
MSVQKQTNEDFTEEQSETSHSGNVQTDTENDLPPLRQASLAHMCFTEQIFRLLTRRKGVV